MGSGPFAARVLEVLLREGCFEISSIITQPAKVVGRKRIIEKTPVAKLAESQSMPVYECANSKQILAQLEPKSCDFVVVCDYGVLLKQAVIDLPKIDTLNIHGSLLPKYRGASPIQEALKNGDAITGVCLQSMVLALDAGDLYTSYELKIDSQMKFAKLRDQLAWLGAKMLMQNLQSIANGNLLAVKQDESKVSHCYKINKEEGLVDFLQNSAVEVYNKHRAFALWPKIYFRFRNLNIIIHDCQMSDDVADYSVEVGCFFTLDKRLFAKCKGGVLEILELQLPSKSKMLVKDFLNGRPRYFHS